MTETDPLLQRAASFLRSIPEPGWEAISARVLTAVHAAPRPGWPLATTNDGAATRGSVYVSDHALRSILARELRRRYLCRPTAITFTVVGTTLHEVHIEVTGSYNTQLRELGDDIRRTVIDLINNTVGTPDSTARRPINVTITDVVTGDPLNR